MQLNIETDSAAFTLVTNDEDNGTPNPHPEVARILRDVADRVEAGVSMGPIHDINGARVGQWWI